MLILIVDRNCIFILSILYISVLAGLYLGAGGTYIWNGVGVNSNVLIDGDFITSEVSTRSGWTSAQNMMDWLQLIEKTGEQFFPRFILTVCKIQPEILINIIKYALIVKMYNQCIFYDIKNFWLKLTHWIV